jgi:hypothetical protein
MANEPSTPPTSAERAMAANAKSRDRQGKQLDRVRRIAAEAKSIPTGAPDDATGPRIGRDTD